MQLSELREYAARRGWTVGDEYTDQGVSGSKESLPELNRLHGRRPLTTEDEMLTDAPPRKANRVGFAAPRHWQFPTNQAENSP